MQWKVMGVMTCLLALGACNGDDGQTSIGSEEATLTVVNDSSFDIDALYLTPTGASSFGDDRLQGGRLLTGEQVTLFGIPCDFYDAQIVDETGAECTLLDLDLCFDDSTWVIDDQGLATCDFIVQTGTSASP